MEVLLGELGLLKQAAKPMETSASATNSSKLALEVAGNGDSKNSSLRKQALAHIDLL